MATSSTTNDTAQPDWTGDKLLSRAVNWMIASKPIFGVMKAAAKAVMKRASRRAGMDWDAHAQQMQQTAELQLQQLCQEFSQQPHPGLQYPSYYTVPFHAYGEGNLCWQAAYEVEPATCAVALRAFKAEGLTAQQAMQKQRGAINSHIQAYHARHGLRAPSSILDIGCSTGISSCWYQAAWPDADITGLDLSPYFLAVAELEEQRRVAADPSSKRIKFVRGLAEATGYDDASWDMVVFSFIAHECPQAALAAFVKEARRIVKRGGVVCFVDMDPRSEALQSLPPVLFTLAKSTEPWSDEYYSFDLEEALRQAGFQCVESTQPDRRNRTVFGIAA
ncbi:hypothetical protein OEZ85_003377 [Tetradesmus obliquus]|uniref:Methyltransferase type 11 domain-containing protein n=1 Tax=Tetradesmus obliquus TaxID=3088 RepID=A0ABY8UB39_TETOB|nr:hypothetical protein OEZ85_003377 [Tetradesmus obliquus]